MNQEQANKYLDNLKKELFQQKSKKIQFKNRQWLDTFPNEAGVYIVREKSKICYIGESGCVRGRIKDMNNTKTHSLRRTIGNLLYKEHPLFNKATTKKSFNPKIETLLEKYMNKNITIAAIPVSIGRKELEEFIIANNKLKYNKKGKRKQVWYNFYYLKDITF